MGERAVVLRRLAYETLLKRMGEKYGMGFEVMLYFVGFELGYYAYENHRELLGDEIDMLFKAKCELFKGLGYGVLEVVKFSYGRAVSRVYESFECELFKGSGRPASHFIRGMITGWDAAAWNAKIDDVKSVEEKCIAKGDSYCEIHVTLG